MVGIYQKFTEVTDNGESTYVVMQHKDKGAWVRAHVENGSANFVGATAHVKMDGSLKEMLSGYDIRRIYFVLGEFTGKKNKFGMPDGKDIFSIDIRPGKLIYDNIKLEIFDKMNENEEKVLKGVLGTLNVQVSYKPDGKFSVSRKRWHKKIAPEQIENAFDIVTSTAGGYSHVWGKKKKAEIQADGDNREKQKLIEASVLFRGKTNETERREKIDQVQSLFGLDLDEFEVVERFSTRTTEKR